MTKVIAIIPARYASTRFPGKPLVQIQGMSMIERVYRQAQSCDLLQSAIVATDDKRIFEHVIAFGGQVMMSDESHQSGTDRCAELAKELDADIIINIQGDEPFIQPDQIQQLAQLMLDNAQFEIGTLIKPIQDEAQLFSPNVVKAVVAHDGKALYFSRHPVPYLRGKEQANYLENHVFYKHIGMYAYRKSTLLAIAELPIGLLEQAESLEQLRWLEHGYAIGTAVTLHESIGIDTPDDLKKLG